MEREFVISIESEPGDDDVPLPTSIYNLYTMMEYDKKLVVNSYGELA